MFLTSLFVSASYCTTIIPMVSNCIYFGNQNSMPDCLVFGIDFVPVASCALPKNKNKQKSNKSVFVTRVLTFECIMWENVSGRSAFCIGAHGFPCKCLMEPGFIKCKGRVVNPVMGLKGFNCMCVWFVLFWAFCPSLIFCCFLLTFSFDMKVITFQC